MTQSKHLIWIDQYNALKDFIEKNDRIPKSVENTWLVYQKQLFKKGKLNKEYIALLKKIDKKIFGKQLNSWDKRYDVFKKFVKQNNRLPKKAEMEWWTAQKHYYKIGQLSKDRIQLLKAIDKNIFASQLYSWTTRYNTLMDFIIKNDRLPNKNEIEWFKGKVHFYKQGNATIERTKLLKELDKKLLELSKRHNHLTDLQKNILTLLQQGHSQNEISKKLKYDIDKFYSVSSIEKEIKKIKFFLGAKTMYHLAIKYEQYKKKTNGE